MRLRGLGRAHHRQAHQQPGATDDEAEALHDQREWMGMLSERAVHEQHRARTQRCQRGLRQPPPRLCHAGPDHQPHGAGRHPGRRRHPAGPLQPSWVRAGEVHGGCEGGEIEADPQREVQTRVARRQQRRRGGRDRGAGQVGGLAAGHQRIKRARRRGFRQQGRRRGGGEHPGQRGEQPERGAQAGPPARCRRHSHPAQV